jgi:Kef-type K+ transport system membrane component KefB
MVGAANNDVIRMASAASSGENTGMSSILQFVIILAVIIVAAKVAGLLSVKVGMPAVLGELLAGVILGPTLLNLFGLPFVTDTHLLEGFQHLAEIGVILLMFMAGLETDLKAIGRVGKVAVLAGVLGVVVPLVIGAGSSLPFGFTIQQALFIGIILTATSVSISAQTMLELGVLKRKEGIALLAAAVIDDVLVIIVLSLFIAFTSGGGGLLDIGLVLGKVLLFFLVAGLIGWKVLPRLIPQAKKLPISEGLTALTVVVILLYSWSAEYLGGVALITGAFIVGVAVSRTEFKHEIEDKFHTLTYGFFVPIFFVSIGLAANLAALAPADFLFAGVIILGAVGGKVIGCSLGARLGGFDNRLSLRLGFGMISRGEVGLIVASVGLTGGLIGQNIYGVMVLMVLVTTLITPPILKLIYRNEKEKETQSVSGHEAGAFSNSPILSPGPGGGTEEGKVSLASNTAGRRYTAAMANNQFRIEEDYTFYTGLSQVNKGRIKPSPDNVKKAETEL